MLLIGSLPTGLEVPGGSADPRPELRPELSHARPRLVASPTCDRDSLAVVEAPDNVPLVSICKEHERAELGRRVSQPAADLNDPVWQRGAKGRFVGFDATAVCRPLGHDQQAGDHGRIPTKPTGDLPGVSHLAIERAQELANVDDRCLQLDHEQRPASWLPREQVHDPALPEPAERHLWSDDPTTERLEPPNDRLGELGVQRVDKSVDVGRARPRQQFDPDVEAKRDLADRSEADRVEMAALHARDRGVGNMHGTSEVALAPTALHACGPNDHPEPNVIHPARVGRGAYRPVAGTAKRVRMFDMIALSSPPDGPTVDNRTGGGGQPSGDCWQGPGERGSKGPERGWANRLTHNM